MPSIKIQLKSEKEKAEKQKRSFNSLKPSKRAVVEVIVLVLLVGLGFYAWQLRSDRDDLQTQLTSLKSNPQAAVQQQTTDLINQVGKLYHLPTGETPTVAAVTNAEQAKKQSAFFKDAQDGDKVLLYVKAGEAILYRPGTNKIILVAPLTFSGNDATGTTKN
jgi:predicted negative regulator of RcsB-dependent stress response